MIDKQDFFWKNIIKDMEGDKMKKGTTYESIQKEMLAIYEIKQSDYGDSVHDTYKDFGLVSFVVRIADKYNRLKTLTKKKDNGEVKDESIRDTLIDMANYCMLAVKELDNDRK